MKGHRFTIAAVLFAGVCAASAWVLLTLDRNDAAPPTSEDMRLAPLFAEAELALSSLDLYGYGDFEISGCVVTQTAVGASEDGSVTRVREAAFDLADIQSIGSVRDSIVGPNPNGDVFAFLSLRPTLKGVYSAASGVFFLTSEVDMTEFWSEVVRTLSPEAPLISDHPDVFQRWSAVMGDDYARIGNRAMFRGLYDFRRVTFERVEGADGAVVFELEFGVGGFGWGNRNQFPHRLRGSAEDVDRALMYLERIQTELCPPSD